MAQERIGGSVNVSISTGSLYIYPLQWIMGMVADAGFDGVELALGIEAVWRERATVRKLAEARGLQVLSVHPPLFPLPGWRSFSETVKLIDYAVEVGASIVVQHTPRTEDLDSADGIAWRRAIDEARSHGMNRGVLLALENRAIFTNEDRQHALSDPEMLQQFAEKHDFPLTLDTSHAASWPHDVIEVYELFRDRLVNLHLSDFRKLPAWLDRPALHTYIKHHQLLGAGDLSLRELMACVEADGYAGLVTMELSPVALEIWRPARSREKLATTVDWIRTHSGPSAIDGSGVIPTRR